MCYLKLAYRSGDDKGCRAFLRSRSQVLVTVPGVSVPHPPELPLPLSGLESDFASAPCASHTQSGRNRVILHTLCVVGDLHLAVFRVGHNDCNVFGSDMVCQQLHVHPLHVPVVAKDDDTVSINTTFTPHHAIQYISFSIFLFVFQSFVSDFV